MNPSTNNISPIEYCAVLDLAYVLLHAASIGMTVTPDQFSRVRDSLMILRQDMAQRHGISMALFSFESAAYAAALMCRQMEMDNHQA